MLYSFGIQTKMLASKPHFYHHRSPVVKQVLAVMIRDSPFDAATTSPPYSWTTQTVSDILRSIPIFFFTPTRSIGRQSNLFRHRAPLKQRDLRQESVKYQSNFLILGPAAYRDLTRVDHGVSKATEFFYWVESHAGFIHNEITVREMAIVLAKANKLSHLWNFLREMSRKVDGELVTTTSITCLMKCLGEEGLVNEAMQAFYRMKQFHCKPDVYAYNTVILALCRVGFFVKAKSLLQQMELPGFRCPPDTYTYTILISSYCKYALQTGCRKAFRRRLWEANHLFRLMLFKGFVPDIVTYNSLIDGCCKTNRIERALELLEDIIKRGCLPNRVTYDSFIRYYSVVNEIDKAIEMLRKMQELNHGTPTTSSYTPIIHALCEVQRASEAWEFLVELVDGGLIPREYTYKLVLDALRCNGNANMLNEETCRMIEDGIIIRYRQRMKEKPFMNRKGSMLIIEEH
ncbi:pentatricopeptide repeat-containing protein At1g77405-like [Chenopodium quinoa]|nr:pentatricopeptide repeat-containing protein At1g77405-like [Chenopodium quinoa]